MANILFRLQNITNVNEPAFIYFCYWYERTKVLKVSLKLKVAPKYWNDKTNRVRNVVECINKDIINNRLIDLENAVEKFITNETAHSRPITKDSLKLFVDEYLTPPKNKIATQSDFIDFINDFADNIYKRTNPTTGRVLSVRLVQEYKHFIRLVKQFCTAKKTKYTFAQIDLAFYADFVEWLQKQNYSNNSIGKFIKDLKVILNDATIKGVNTNLAYKNSRFKVISEQVDNIYLSESELIELYELDLSHTPALDSVRNLFLVGCFTGLRFSDFTSITADNVHNDYLHITQQKTGGRVVIPIHPIVKSILQRYNYKLPRGISNQKFNDYLKEVTKLAQFNEPEQKQITKGGAKLVLSRKRWQMVTTHTARRTFATNAYLQGIQTLTIMQITGHKTERSFMRYIKIDNKQHAQLMRNHWAKNGVFINIAK